MERISSIAEPAGSVCFTTGLRRSKELSISLLVQYDCFSFLKHVGLLL